jgi:AcrR family transcriptional regulator
MHLFGDEAEITDKRLLRGARSRQIVLRRAVDLASLEGLVGLSFGRLASDTGLSKAGVQVMFKTKEALQLATIDYAREMFIDAVVSPVRSTRHGVARLRALVDRWIVYAETPLFEGGCFRAANLPDYDSRPGPVRDALFRDQNEWLAFLAEEVRRAVVAGEIRDTDPGFTAFLMDAVLCAANTALRAGDTEATDKVRRFMDAILAA